MTTPTITTPFCRRRRNGIGYRKAQTIAQAVFRAGNVGRYLWCEARHGTNLAKRLWFVTMAEETFDQREARRTRLHVMAGVSIVKAVTLGIY
jgi:hypothetical protein